MIEVDEGAPLSLQCNPPPGLPSPVIFWMSSCESGQPPSHLEPRGQPSRHLQPLFKITLGSSLLAQSLEAPRCGLGQGFLLCAATRGRI